MDFPPDFLWGAATSAYQIEDAARDHLWERDVALMADLGLKAYRFSIAWPRIQPTGRGAPATAGLDFYSRLIDRLLDRGISPCATLYHWDLPQALEDLGGWAARDTAGWFTDYADIVFRRLGDRIPRFITHSDPWRAAFLCHLRAVHAPGHKDLNAALASAHHLLLSHGRAVEACRTSAPTAQIGITLGLFPTYPLREDHEGDRAAAVLADVCTNRWFLDPIYRGAYPADGLEHMRKLGGRLDFIDPSDLYMISLRTDFLGVGYYHRRVVEDDPKGGDLGWREHDRVPGVPTTDLGWEIVPDCMVDLLNRLHAEYEEPLIYITENGAAFDDAPGPDGTVVDTRRVDYLRAHFEAARTAMSKGVKLAGYFVWSLLDDSEGAGHAGHFGIVHIDESTQTRTPKASGRYLARVIREGLAGADSG